MANEKNVIWTIQKVNEPVQKLLKALEVFEKEYDKSTEGTANIVRKAGGQLLKVAGKETGTLEGYQALLAQVYDRQTEKLEDKNAVLKEKIDARDAEITSLKLELKESQNLAKRNEEFPEKIAAQIKKVAEFIDAEVVRD